MARWSFASDCIRRSKRSKSALLSPSLSHPRHWVASIALVQGDAS